MEKAIYVLGAIILVTIVYIKITNHSVITPIAVKLNKPGLCPHIHEFMNFGGGDFVGSCYSSVAIAYNDVSVCNNLGQIVDDFGRVHGRYPCYVAFAVAKNDPSVCASEGNLGKDNCYLDYSRRLEDIKVCKNIVNDRDQTFCYEYFKNNKGDDCFEMEHGSERLRCIKQVACSNFQC